MQAIVDVGCVIRRVIPVKHNNLLVRLSHEETSLAREKYGIAFLGSFALVLAI